MEVSEAIDLIKPAQRVGHRPQIWADLGCGSGIFSRALASLLPNQSNVICCDKDSQTINPNSNTDVGLQFKQLDFEKEVLNVLLDGILMANALHYVEDKQNLLLKWKTSLNRSGTFIIVEYDTEESNPWVPYPIGFLKLEKLFFGLGMETVRMLGQRRSSYGNKQMYACEIRISE